MIRSRSVHHDAKIYIKLNGHYVTKNLSLCNVPANILESLLTISYELTVHVICHIPSTLWRIARLTETHLRCYVNFYAIDFTCYIKCNEKHIWNACTLCIKLHERERERKKDRGDRRTIPRKSEAGHVHRRDAR